MFFDGSKTKLPAVQARKPGEPHPYVIGADAVQRYMTVVNECAQAGLAAFLDDGDGCFEHPFAGNVTSP